jgi:hypothetical protein
MLVLPAPFHVGSKKAAEALGAKEATFWPRKEASRRPSRRE